MFNENLRDFSLHRLKRAKDDLDSAKIEYEAKKYNAVANRAYYSIFHTIRSILVLDEVEFKKHSAIISYFTKTYLLTNIINRKYSITIKAAFEARNAGDYDDYCEISSNEAFDLIEKATEFHLEIVKYISKRLEITDDIN